MNFGAANVHIRPMTPDDVERVLEIQSKLPSLPHWPRLAWIDVLNSSAALRHIALVAAQAQGASADRSLLEIHGFAVASLSTPQAELEVIAVAAEHRRMGLGRRLLAALVEQLRHAGTDELLLEVRASNLAAIGFYRSAGFSRVGARAGYYADPVEDAALMNLRLK